MARAEENITVQLSLRVYSQPFRYKYIKIIRVLLGFGFGFGFVLFCFFAAPLADVAITLAPYKDDAATCTPQKNEC